MSDQNALEENNANHREELDLAAANFNASPVGVADVRPSESDNNILQQILKNLHLHEQQKPPKYNDVLIINVI